MQYILSLITFIAVFAGYAQKIEDISLKHSMKQDGLSLQFTVLDPDEKGIKHHDTGKTYFWYKAQKVIGTQGGSSGMLLHGLYESFYSNKQLCEKGSYAKGLKDGKWLYWRTDGTLIKTENWKNGTQHGEQIDFSSTGIIQKRTVIRGRHTTMECGDTLVEISGESKKITLMDSIGRVTSIARYQEGLLHGKQESFASDGSKSVVSYKKGALVEPKPEKEKSQETTAEKKKLGTRFSELFRKKEKTTGTPETTPKKARAKKHKEAETADPSGNAPAEKKKRSLNPFKKSGT